MRMRRVLDGALVLGVLLLAASAILFAVDERRWASTLLVLGLGCVLSHVVFAARRTREELSTTRSNIARGRREQLERDHSAQESLDQLLNTRLSAVEARVEDLLREVRLLGDDLADDLGEEPALTAWRDVERRRREGTVCLLMGERDGALILGQETLGVRFELLSLDNAALDHRASPTVPPHAVGALLIDLDLFSALTVDRDQWTGFVRWLRRDVPVTGFSRVPGHLSLRAGSLTRSSAGMLLPTVNGPNTVTFHRGSERREGVRA